MVRGSFLPFYLMADLDRGIGRRRALIATELGLFISHLLCPLSECRDWGQVKVRVEMPEEGARDADKRPVGVISLALLDGFDRLLVDRHFVESCLDQAAGCVLELLASLHQQVVARGNLDRDPVASVAGPDVQARVAGSAVNGEKVEVGVEAGEDGVLLAVFYQVRSGRGQEMGSEGESQSANYCSVLPRGR